MLYGGPGNIVADVAESFLAVSYIGIVFGIPCAVMALLNFAGVVRLAVKWEEQRILSITDAFGRLLCACLGCYGVCLLIDEHVLHVMQGTAR